MKPALKFITCGSVDDGKSTLIGRLLVDSKAVLQDQLAAVSRTGAADLALLTDGLSAEREQGITIDVAWRYFATPVRKFIIGDSPGHEQYTRNMVTAASQAEAAVVLVDATKLDWQHPQLQLLPQTRRHSLLCHLLRVPHIVVAINKLDAVANPDQAFINISAALRTFASAAGVNFAHVVPVSALQGWNIIEENGMCPAYTGPSLLQILEQLPVSQNNTDAQLPLAFAVQWVEKTASSAATTHEGRRIYWGKVASGALSIGTALQLPNGRLAHVARLLSNVRENIIQAKAGSSAGLVLDQEVDVSRGDWLQEVATKTDNAAPADEFAFDAPTASSVQSKALTATVAWLDEEPLRADRVYWALHGHKWVKAKVQAVLSRTDIGSLASTAAEELQANDIGQVSLTLQEALPVLPYAQSKQRGALVLVDGTTHKTSGAVMVN
jgi:sulfate adenylyltransferase subunit 1